MKEKLEAFIFDNLGDMADPQAFQILNEHNIIVSHSGLVNVPMDVLLDEWNDAKKGTEFEKVKLFVPAN